MAYTSFNYRGLIVFFLVIFYTNALDVYVKNSLSSSHYYKFKKTKSENWTELVSVEDVWNSYPEKIRYLFERLDFDNEGLNKVKHSVQEGDTIKAAKELLSYYQESDSGSWLRNKNFDQIEQSDIKTANEILDDIVTLNGDSASVAYQDKPGWRWKYLGPNNDKEFAYKLSGHENLISLYKVWQHHKDEDYVKKYDSIMRDWIINNPLPAKGDSLYMVHQTTTEVLDWRDISEVSWRDIEAGVRLGATWIQMFYGFQESNSFLPATRILMLSSIAEHIDYVKNYHKDGTNWVTIEMDGLALAGLAFPEFKQAEENAMYALKIMEEEIDNQVYPDGVQKELTSLVQWVALKRFEALADNFIGAKRDIPESYLDKIVSMYNYMAYSMRPNGNQPLNSDSDLVDVRSRVLLAAEKYDRPDWTWIATNGQQGSEPKEVTSVTFPWAGIHVMRDSWKQDSNWSFFDTGPFGTGHQHADKLHLSVSAYGKDLLVDGGRYIYEDYFSFDPASWRGYFRSSFSHNVVLVDGKGQNKYSESTEKPLQEGVDFINNSDFDFAIGTFKDGYNGVVGVAEHTRSTLYVKGKYWVVVDQVRTDRPRDIQALWHFSPTCAILQEEESQVVSVNPDEPNLRIVPLSKNDWDVNITKGQTEPFIQGWYSSVYGERQPNSTAVYNSETEESISFAWILIPGYGSVQEVQASITDINDEIMEIKIVEETNDQTLVSVPLKTGITPKISH